MSELEDYQKRKDLEKHKKRAQRFETSPYLRGTSELYRINYDKIDWSKKDQSESKV